MEEFTLYQTLSKNIKTTAMADKQMTELCKKLKGANHQVIAKLILEHHIKTSEDDINVENPKIPYGGVQSQDETRFDLKKLPNTLKWILWKFVNIN